MQLTGLIDYNYCIAFIFLLDSSGHVFRLKNFQINRFTMYYSRLK